MQGYGDRKHWHAFTAWCNEHGVCALRAAPQTLAARADEGREGATLALVISAISQAAAPLAIRRHGPIGS